MKSVVIVGAGFAGLSAARALSSESQRASVTLVNRSPRIEYRPLLPDAAGGTIPYRRLYAPVNPYASRYNFRFVEGEVVKFDTDRNRVHTESTAIPYDYCIIATGSQTNFYGNAQIESQALKLDCVPDARSLHSALSGGGYDHIVVCGGGYTGVETATFIRSFFTRHGASPKISIVEMLDSLVKPLPRWMKRYVVENLERMDIAPRTETKVESLEDRSISLSDGTTIDNALLVWTAGMKAAACTEGIDAPRGSQKRLAVDDFLRVRDNVFAAGNVACYTDNGGCSRMAAQMSVAQGMCAARNVVRNMEGGPLEAFRQVDWGFLVPMANWRSCGKLFGLNVKGELATRLHYLVNAYRSFGTANKVAVLRRGLWRA